MSPSLTASFGEMVSREMQNWKTSRERSNDVFNNSLAGFMVGFFSGVVFKNWSESTRRQAEAQLGIAHGNAWKKQLRIAIADGVTPVEYCLVFHKIK
jgi:hypothetical protein